MVVFLYDARRRQMEHLHRSYSVEPSRGVPVQRHCASLRLHRFVFGVPAENISPSSVELSRCDAYSIRTQRALGRALAQNRAR